MDSSKIKTLYLQGQPKHLKTFRDSVTLITNQVELLILKYDGYNGLVKSSTVYQTKNPFNAYTFFKVRDGISIGFYKLIVLGG